MTISASILALTPSLYWRLDDAAGISAADASGHGASGTYNGIVSFRQPGPEAGTSCVAMGSNGFVISTAASPRQAAPWSATVWVAVQGPQPLNSTVFYNGNSAARGAGLVWDAGAPNGAQVKLLRGGIGFGGIVGNIQPGAWHNYTQTWDAALNVNQYLDGVFLNGGAAPYNAINAGDPFLTGGVGGEALFLAHAALFPAQLTGAQALSIFNGAGGAVTPSPLQPCSGADVSAILADVLAILAAVRKTFP